MRSESPRQLLELAITRSRLSTRQFARLLGRDERLVRRWLAGDLPVPLATASWLRAFHRSCDRTETPIAPLLERGRGGRSNAAR
jgi:hypothetical protein